MKFLKKALEERIVAFNYDDLTLRRGSKITKMQKRPKRLGIKEFVGEPAK